MGMTSILERFRRFPSLSPRGVFRFAVLTLVSGLVLFRVSSAVVAAEPAFRDLEYARVSDTALLLDLYLPDNDPGPHPLIIWVHGGAWRGGSKKDVPIAPLVSQGFAIASVDYRLSPVAPFPAQIHDIKAAIRWLRASHQRWHLDSRRFVIAGASAGGHLAALTGVSDGIPELEGQVGSHINVPSRVHAIVSFYGASNLQTILAQSTPFGLNVRIPALDLFLGGQPDARPEIARLASPVVHVDSGDPPLWLYHGDQDPQMPINQSHELQGAYERVNRPVQFQVMHNARHGGPEFYQEDLLRKLGSDLRRTLQPGAESSGGPRKGPPPPGENDGVRAKTYQLTPAERASLPPIHTFRDQPSRQFLIPWQDLRSGHPYLGTQAMKPHTGAHLYFRLPDEALDPSRPEQYPPIYAVADGIVTRVDEAFRLRSVYFPSLGISRANLRYGVDVTFAGSGSELVSFHYSIEPMVDPGSMDFYKPFIRVKPGQRVRQGDVIATMYLPPDPQDAENSHIHFNLMRGRDFQSPSIFHSSVDEKFSATWDAQRLRDDWPIPACMGWRLGPGEDPFRE